MAADNAGTLNKALVAFELLRLETPGLVMSYPFRLGDQWYEFYECVPDVQLWVYKLIYSERLGRYIRVENSGKLLDEWKKEMNL